MRIWHFKLRNIRRYAAYLGRWLCVCIYWMSETTHYLLVIHAMAFLVISWHLLLTLLDIWRKTLP